MASQLSTTVLLPPMDPTTPASSEEQLSLWKTHQTSWPSVKARISLSKVALSTVEDLVKSALLCFHQARHFPHFPTRTPRASLSKSSTPSKEDVPRRASLATHWSATLPLPSIPAPTISLFQLRYQPVMQPWLGLGSTRSVTAKCT